MSPDSCAGFRSSTQPTALLARTGRQRPYSEIVTAVGSSGHWQGETWNRRRNGAPYPAWLAISAVPGADHTPECYVAVFSDISRIRQSQQELERLAHHDPLTGLPNRLLFDARLAHALVRARRGCSSTSTASRTSTTRSATRSATGC